MGKLEQSGVRRGAGAEWGEAWGKLEQSGVRRGASWSRVG